MCPSLSADGEKTPRSNRSSYLRATGPNLDLLTSPTTFLGLSKSSLSKEEVKKRNEEVKKWGEEVKQREKIIFQGVPGHKQDSVRISVASVAEPEIVSPSLPPPDTDSRYSRQYQTDAPSSELGLNQKPPPDSSWKSSRYFTQRSLTCVYTASSSGIQSPTSSSDVL